MERGNVSDSAPDRTSNNRKIPLIYVVKQVELAVRAGLDDATASADLTAHQYTALTVLERHPGITSAELARSSFVRAQTMAEMVTYLLGRGLISRERDGTNQRQYLLFLSHDGRKVLAGLSDAVADIEAKMLADFDGGQVEILRTYLLRCRHNNYYDKILNYQNKFRSMVLLILSIPKTYIFSKVCNNPATTIRSITLLGIINDQKYLQLTIYLCNK